jgi:hypothetical protein
MEDSERWSRRVISHAPGMVFQYVLRDDGRYAMPFVSDQCVNVLGVPVDTLRENPALFEEIILWKDRKSFRDSRVQSAAGLVTWNWEGRLWIDRLMM